MKNHLGQFGESMQYLEINKRHLFIHKHIFNSQGENVFIFLNPIFDEKKRTQKFYVDTARELCKNGVNVIRFDYYGTGDSLGNLTDFSFVDALEDLEKLVSIIREGAKIKSIFLFGLRIGADLAAHLSLKNNIFEYLFLVEPVINGQRYLFEQRTRRKIFHKIKKIDPYGIFFEHNNQKFEDFQGYPLNISSLDYLGSLCVDSYSLKDKKILLFKLKSAFSSKDLYLLKDKLTNNNEVGLIEVPCKEFWANLEPVDTTGLTADIVRKFKKYVKDI